jgi:ABC-type branched-subunit amino acid transport system substrate-binding protein
MGQSDQGSDIQRPVASTQDMPRPHIVAIQTDEAQGDPNHQNQTSSQANTSPFPWFQLLLAVVVTIAYIKNNKPDFLSTVFFEFITLAGMEIFAPLFSKINVINECFRKAISALLKVLKWLPHETFARGKKGNKQGLKKVVARISLFVLYILVTIFFLFQNFFMDRWNAFSDFACITAAWRTFCSSDIGVTTLRAPDGTSVTVGLVSSANKAGIPFDKSGLSGASKEQDVDNKILLEQDTKNGACSGTHITLAVVTMLSRTVSDTDLSASVGLEDLRGAYLAQKDRNKQPGIKLCLVIANIGTLATAQYALPLVVKQLILFSKSDASFRGIIGFPFSQHVDKALNIFKAWGQHSIPIVSPSATSDNFSQKPNFYRIVASDDVQSDIIAKFIKEHFVPSFPCPQAEPTIAVFYDTSGPDPYSTSLATAFQLAMNQNQVCAAVIHEPYAIGDSDSIEKHIQDAIVRQGAMMIFFAGYANDIDAVEYGIQLA